MLLVSKIQEARIRRQERKKFKKILRDFAKKTGEIQRKLDRRAAVTYIQLGFCEGFDTGKTDPGLSREGFYTKAMTFANEKADSILGSKS